MFEYVCANLAALTADEIQEFQNSRLGGMVHNPTNMSEEYLARKSVLQKYLSSIRELIETVAGSKRERESNKVSELTRLLHMYEKERYKASIQHMQSVILEQLDKICEGTEWSKGISAVNKDLDGLKRGVGIFGAITNTRKILENELPWEKAKLGGEDGLKSMCARLETELEGFVDDGQPFQPEKENIRTKIAGKERYLKYVDIKKRMVKKRENERLRNTSCRERVRRPSSRLDFNN